jgi:hypothetical protein
MGNQLMPLLQQMDQLKQVGETYFKSGLFATLRNAEQATIIVLKAHELNLGVTEAFQSISVIKGKLTISSQLMLALAERSGFLEDYKIFWDDTNSPKSCTCEIKRKDRSIHSETFTLSDADGQGLLGNYNWKSMPKIMLKWRAVSACLRVTFGDVLAGMYTHEELGAKVDADGEFVAVAVEQEPTQKAKATVSTPAPVKDVEVRTPAEKEEQRQDDTLKELGINLDTPEDKPKNGEWKPRFIAACAEIEQRCKDAYPSQYKSTKRTLGEKLIEDVKVKYRIKQWVQVLAEQTGNMILADLGELENGIEVNPVTNERINKGENA